MSRRPTDTRAVRASELGATAVEYSLLLAGIAAVIVGAVAALGQTVLTLFQSIPAGA